MKITLIAMPFAAIDRPALGVSTLKAGLQRLGFECRALYLNLVFADRLGLADYRRFVDDSLPYTSLAGEWVFTGCLYGSPSDGNDAYVDRVLRGTWRLSDDDVELVRRARTVASGFLDTCLVSYPWGEYDVVGFSSFCAQNVASLALARLIKLTYPHVRVVFGGHNWEGPMGQELLRRFPFVDAAFSGHADVSLPTLLQRVEMGDHAWGDIPGLTYRDYGRARVCSEIGLVEDLDTLPMPDHDDYFETLSQSGLSAAVSPSVPLETTRGCWWAAARPCLFCGQNGSAPTFRSKSPERTLRELRWLSDRWDGHPLVFSDNVVSPLFLSTVLPQLASGRLTSPLSFMVRSDVGRDQVRAIKSANASIRSGVESLSEHALHLMHKGVGALENIRLLKWCAAYGVDHRWNLLYACPGETAKDYRDVIEMVGSLRFLGPPEGCGPLLIERFSRYFQEPAKHGFGRIRPLDAYSYVYPFPESALRRIAYFFDHGYRPALGTLVYINSLRTEVERWQAGQATGSLQKQRTAGGGLVLLDTRREGTVTCHRLDGGDRLLYEACDDIGERSDLYELARAQLEPPLSPDQVDSRLSAFVRDRLMVRVDDRYLSLALPEQLPPADARSSEPGGLATREG